MRKRAGVALVALGALCLAAALALFISNFADSRRAGDEAQQRALALDAYINRTPDPDKLTALAPADATQDEESVVYLDGYDYIGVLEIPALDLTLPVMSTWDYERLRLSPCRQFGSVDGGNLVIAAHNYDSHFGRLGSLIAGDAVYFTDTDGVRHGYAVDHSDVLQPTDVDRVANSGFPLTLYTCTKGGAARVTVFCVDAESAESAEPTE